MKVRATSRARIGIAIIASAVVAFGAALFAYQYWPRDVPPTQPPLLHITTSNLGELRDSFNSARGRVRVMALLSPT